MQQQRAEAGKGAILKHGDLLAQCYFLGLGVLNNCITTLHCSPVLSVVKWTLLSGFEHLLQWASYSSAVAAFSLV